MTVTDEPIYYGPLEYSGPIYVESCGLCNGIGSHEFGKCVRCQGGGLVSRPKDNCEVCNGSKGGIPGNENVINGRVMCDYCHAESMK
jgi:hypothetical protein